MSNSFYNDLLPLVRTGGRAICEGDLADCTVRVPCRVQVTLGKAWWIGTWNRRARLATALRTARGVARPYLVVLAEDTSVWSVPEERASWNAGRFCVLTASAICGACGALLAVAAWHFGLKAVLQPVLFDWLFAWIDRFGGALLGATCALFVEALAYHLFRPLVSGQDSAEAVTAKARHGDEEEKTPPTNSDLMPRRMSVLGIGESRWT